jgi:hypothetical protein
MALGQFPALRHFKIQPSAKVPEDHAIMLQFLKQLLSISSPNTSHIETLAIEITWRGFVDDWTDFGHDRTCVHHLMLNGLH